METKIRNSTIGKARAFKDSSIRVYQLQFGETGPVMVHIKNPEVVVEKPKSKGLYPKYK